MGWLEEAQKKLEEIEKNDDFNDNNENELSLDNQEQREKLIKNLKIQYMNATQREVEKAIDFACEKLEKPYDKKEFMKILRVKLED